MYIKNIRKKLRILILNRRFLSLRKQRNIRIPSRILIKQNFTEINFPELQSRWVVSAKKKQYHWGILTVVWNRDKPSCWGNLCDKYGCLQAHRYRWADAWPDGSRSRPAASTHWGWCNGRSGAGWRAVWSSGCWAAPCRMTIRWRSHRPSCHVRLCRRRHRHQHHRTVPDDRRRSLPAACWRTSCTGRLPCRSADPCSSPASRWCYTAPKTPSKYSMSKSTQSQRGDYVTSFSYIIHLFRIINQKNYKLQQKTMYDAPKIIQSDLIKYQKLLWTYKNHRYLWIKKIVKFS